MYKVIIFDIDGTLVDTDRMLIETYKTLYAKYRKDLKNIDIDKIKTFSGPPIKETLLKEFPNEDQDKMLNEYKFYSHENYIKYVYVFPGVKEVLLKLKKDGYILTIATSKMRDASFFTLKLVGLENIFNLLVCSDDVINPKPDRESIDKIIANYNVSYKEVLFVGDTKYDAYCADNAGVDCVLMRFFKRAIPEDAKFIKYCNNFNELYTFIKDRK